MTNNIQKAFKTKSKLRGMADGGRVDSRIFGSGMAQRAGSALQGRRAQLEAAIDAASGAPPPTAPVAADRAKKPEEKSTLRSFFGLADGGKVKGKGGPTDDKVGPVMLSDGEYVLPADTVKIVGRDKLDALRLATHDFVDDRNKPKVSSLRKMADGGVFYVDPEGVASRQMSPGRAVAPYQPRAPQAIDVEARNVSGAAGAASPAATSSLRTAINSGGGRVGGFIRGALPVAAFGGAVDSFGDMNTGYRDRFNESIGATGPVSSVAGDTARVMGNVGDAITFGLAGRLGRGLSNLASGQSFTEGFMSESDRDKYNREQTQRVMGQQAPTAAAAPQSRPSEFPGMSNVPAGVRASSAGVPATPVQPQSYQSRRLAEMGVPVDQQNLAPVTEDTRRSLLREGGGTPGQYVNLGSYGGDANIYGTASKPGGRIDTLTGVGASARPGGGPQEDPIMGEIRSALRGLTNGAGNRGVGGGAPPDIGSASEINARYDRMLRSGVGRNTVRGLDWSQRHGLGLERARASELGELARNQAALRGQDMQASTAANNANMQARMQALQTLGTLANQRSLQNAQAQAAQLKALQDAQKMGMEREEKGFERYNDAISRMFTGPDGEPDAAEQERFTSFLQASDPQASEKFAAMSPQDQMVLLQNFKTLYDMQKARNATAERGGGAITNRADMPVDVREATWNDYWNNNLPLGDYVWSNLPFTNPNVVVTESGQPVLMSDAATTDGNWDADKLELIRQRTGKGTDARSVLRRN
jgi:hypothetical protein